MRIAAAVLAAGRGSRFGAGPTSSKVVARIGGEPLVRRSARLALAARAQPVLVVTGHAAPAVAAAVHDLPVRLVANEAYAKGLATSLHAALDALGPDVDGLLVLLADMPLVRAPTLGALMADYDPAVCDAVVPRIEGKIGNPVLLGRALFPAVRRIEGDRGARALLSAPQHRIRICEVDDPGILTDIDTPEALAQAAREPLSDQR